MATSTQSTHNKSIQERHFLADAVKSFLQYQNIGYITKMSLRRVINIIRPTQEYCREEIITLVSLVALDAEELAATSPTSAEAIRTALAIVVARIESLPYVEEP